MRSKFIDGSDATAYQAAIAPLVNAGARLCEEVREADEPTASTQRLRGRVSVVSTPTFDGSVNKSYRFTDAQDAIDFYARVERVGAACYAPRRDDAGRWVVQVSTAGTPQPKVTESNAWQFSPGCWSADASDLRLPPGLYPHRLPSDIGGSTADWVLYKRDGDGAVYKRDGGIGQLVVFPD